MSTPRPPKHDRPASTVSRSPKRSKGADREEAEEGDEDGQSAAMSWEATKGQTGKGKKRNNVDVEGSTEAGSVDGEEDVSEESGDDDDAAASKEKPKPSKKDSKKKTKLPRIEGKLESPSNLANNNNNKKAKAKRKEELQLQGAKKGKGKRVVDESEDHEIGDEWTDLNGLRWRMDDDGQLRRQAVVVEMRPRYPSMPKDSRHPDAKLKIQVHVEKFMTEEEYDEAKTKKLLSFQEIERQREVEEAEAAAKRKREDEEEARRARIANDGGRLLTTPKKIRDLQALFTPATKSRSPSRTALPFPIVRSRSGSHAPSTPLSSSSSSVKRLSLKMGSDARKSAEEHAHPATPQTPQTPLAAKATPPPAKVSYRLPLASPSSPGVNAVSATSVRASPIGDLKAKRKREEVLLKLLQEEAERRKKREEVK